MAKQIPEKIFHGIREQNLAQEALEFLDATSRLESKFGPSWRLTITIATTTTWAKFITFAYVKTTKISTGSDDEVFRSYVPPKSEALLIGSLIRASY